MAAPSGRGSSRVFFNTLLGVGKYDLPEFCNRIDVESQFRRAEIDLRRRQ